MQCGGCTPSKAYGQHTSEKCVRKTRNTQHKLDVRKIARKTARKQWRKRANNIVKQTNCDKHKEKELKYLWKMVCWDHTQHHFWVRKLLHRNFHSFRARLFAALCWRGLRFVSYWTHCRGIIGTGACFPAYFPDEEAHLPTHVLGHPWQILFFFIRASYWCNWEIIVKIPWRFALSGVS